MAALKRNLSLGSLPLLLAAAGCSGGAGMPAESDSLQNAEPDPVTDEPVASPSNQPELVSVHGVALAATTGARDPQGIPGAMVCVTEPFARCAITAYDGAFELPQLPPGEPLDLSVVQSGFVPAMQTIEPDEPIEPFLVPLEKMPGSMDAALDEGGAVVVRVLPLNYVPREDSTHVGIQLDEGRVAYARPDGAFDETLEAVTDAGVAVIYGLAPGERRVSARELGNDSCVFLEGQHYAAEMSIDVPDAATTTVTLLCSRGGE